MDLIEAAAPKGRAEPPKQLTRVSERFYRADNPGKIFGTGLGMSHVKEIPYGFQPSE